MKSFNILFITQEDPFYVRLFFEEFLKHFKSLQNIKGIAIAPAMGKKSFGKLVEQMYQFYGLRDFVKVGLKYVFYKLGDRVSRIIPVGRFYSITQLCRYYQIPVIKTVNINSAEFLDQIRMLDPDLIISVAAPQIFKERLRQVPKKGCINIHNSRLPKYRGMLPNFWQMFHGEKSVGTTIHRINAGIDDGEILLQNDTLILPGESLESIICKTKRSGARLMIEAIKGIEADSLKPIQNPVQEATYFTFPTRQDVIAFRKKGYRLI